MPRRLPYGWLLGVGAGLLVALVDRVDSDAGQVLLVVTAAGGVLAGLRPLGWWRWGLLVGLAVPVTEELAWLQGWTDPVPADPGGAIVAVGPALLGAYLGMVVGRLRTGRPR